MKHFVCVTLFLISAGSMAFAQQQRPPIQQLPLGQPPKLGQQMMMKLQANNPCGPDFRRFCSGVVPGGGALLDCLDRHKPQLVPVCRTRLAFLDSIRVKGKIAEQKAVARAKKSGAVQPDSDADEDTHAAAKPK